MTGCDDDYDPLAPMPASEAPEEEPAVEDDPLAAPAYGAADDDEPEGAGFDDTDGGFSDYDRIVRIWVEDGRLTKVRLSPVWFHKVPDAAGLESRFRQAFLLSCVRLEPEHDEPPRSPEVPADVLESFVDLPELSRRSLVMFDQLGKEMDERHAAALAEHQAPPPPAPVSGRSKGVTITLNGAGIAERVAFDPKWLDDAQVGSICTHVMLAAERAYARFDPNAATDPVLDDMAAEREEYRAALLTMFTPRDMR